MISTEIVNKNFLKKIKKNVIIIYVNYLRSSVKFRRRKIFSKSLKTRISYLKTRQCGGQVISDLIKFLP